MANAKETCESLMGYLKWCMLAACTVGPGTVIVCSKGGADYGVSLMWALIAACFLAFMLQSEASRLTICSGMSFGQAIRVLFKRDNSGDSGSGEEGGGEKMPKSAVAVVVGVAIGNTAYTANTIVGGLSALYILYENNDWFRIIQSIVLGSMVLLALLRGNINQIGNGLGVIVMAMTLIFLITACQVSVPAGDFFYGLFVPHIPAGSSSTTLAMVGTTCLPFNAFLAVSMVDRSDPEPQKSIQKMKRGIGFATVMTGIISILIVVIGSDISLIQGQSFAVPDLGIAVGKSLGSVAKVLFCIGLYAAALSSAITCPLGISLTAQQVFLDGRDEADHDAQNVDNGQTNIGFFPRNWDRKGWRTSGKYYNWTMIACVGISVLAAAVGADTVVVIFLASIINGLLLPIIAVLLFFCLNDPRIMPLHEIPSKFMNCCLIMCMFVSIVLAFNEIMNKISLVLALLGVTSNTPDRAWDPVINIGIAFGIACVAVSFLVWLAHKRFSRYVGTRLQDKNSTMAVTPA